MDFKPLDTGKTPPHALLPLSAYLQAACAISGLDLDSELGQALLLVHASVCVAFPPMMILDFREGGEQWTEKH